MRKRFEGPDKSEPLETNTPIPILSVVTGYSTSLTSPLYSPAMSLVSVEVALALSL